MSDLEREAKGDREGWNEPMSAAEIADLEGVWFYDDGYAAAKDVTRLIATLDAEDAARRAAPVAPEGPDRRVVLAYRRHLERGCECPKWPECAPHDAKEWGGGEPDDCSPHVHAPAEGVAELEERVIEELDLFYAFVIGITVGAPTRVTKAIRESRNVTRDAIRKHFEEAGHEGTE